jgi:plasmid stabilization system protein ParE
MAYDQGTDDEKKKKKEIETKVNSLVQEARTLRSERAELINETWRLAKPHRRRINETATKAPVLTQGDLADIVDATLAETMHDFGSDMIAQFTPESEPWVKFSARETVPIELKSDVEKVIAMTQMLTQEAIEESSYFDAAPQCFQDLANGTMAARGRRPMRGGDPRPPELVANWLARVSHPVNALSQSVRFCVNS